jgi:isopenicillin N synthase-like dioxygenase
MAAEIAPQFFAVDRQHSLQEFVLPESLRLDTVFENFAAEDEFPVLDLHADDGVDAVARLACAAETWGFFKVKNHGVPLQLIQKVMAHMQEFFATPIEKKMRVRADMPRSYQGYTPGTMIVDVDGKHPCWTERLFFLRRKEAFLELANRVWPHDVHDQIRQDLLQYLEHMDALSSRLIKLLSQGLGVKLASQQFGELHDSSCGNFIGAHYPPCPRPDLVRGLRSHTDPHSLSILYQEYPGLQLLKDGKWLAVKPEAGAFVVNIGDMLQIWSNGRYKSVQHRVALNTSTSRFSLIFFKNPRDHAVISAPAEIVDDEHPRKYKDVSWREYTMLVASGTAKVGHLIDKITIQ